MGGAQEVRYEPRALSRPQQCTGATSLCLGLLALALVGCGSDTEPVRETTAATDTAYAGLMGTIPDTPELRQQVYINDYALAEFSEWLRMKLGFEGEADDPPVRGFGAISFFGPFNQYRNITAENLQHLAFDVRSMDQSFVALALPVTLDVVRGRFDPHPRLPARPWSPAPSANPQPGGVRGRLLL